MTRKPVTNAKEDGMALVLFAVLLVVLGIFAGFAIDAGRLFLVKAQMTKAVDGAALAAARALGSTASATPEKDEAVRIFQANFPSGYLGVSSVTDPTTAADFFSKVYLPADGANIITVKASATLPMTLMRLARFGDITVRSSGTARRRQVDLSLAIDCSGSIGSTDWVTVSAAARRFINSFDGSTDRISVTLFSDGAHVSYQMPPARGFNKTNAMNAVPTNLPDGSTSMAEGLYRAWDELRAVPLNTQAGLRVIVLFTDGTPNGVSGNFTWSPSGNVYTGKSLNTNDFPSVGGYGTSQPSFFGLSDSDCNIADTPNCFRYPYSGASAPIIPNSGSDLYTQVARNQYPRQPPQFGHSDNVPVAN
jgi:Flp pilus assembly protein TadG